ncbi:subtilase-type protease inhibitor [Streptomyces sp. NPDC003077]|uniref:subtilase-type protease inhibitor n=1 Tax=Streptomyces sp. NPDC003077 TaxID=3154443 RepID=UPI0033ADA4BC
MRYILGGITLGAALVAGGLAATTAQAQPTSSTQPTQTVRATEQARPMSLYAPSALVLTVGPGESAATTTAQRAVTLTCAPTPSGTHPDPRGACNELRALKGDFTAVTHAPSDRVCTKEWAPITVTAQGVWEGNRVSYEHTFANACAMIDGKGRVFEF